MHTRINRTVYKNVCDCLVVNSDNTTTHEEVIIYGNYADMTRLQNAIKRKLNNERVLLEHVNCKKYNCSMPVEKFFSSCDQITQS